MGKPCSSRLSTLLMAATVGCDRDVSLRVSSSLGISWNSRSSLAFLAASLFGTRSAGHTVRLDPSKSHGDYYTVKTCSNHLPGFCQQLDEMLEQRQVELVGSVEPDLWSRRIRLRLLPHHCWCVCVTPRIPHLEVTEQVLEGGGVGNDGGLVAAVDGSHQGEGEVEDVAVE